MVIEHYTLHHSCGLIPVLDTQDIAVDSVVEYSRRNLDLFLRLPYVLPERVDLVVGLGNKGVDDEECRDGDDYGGYEQGSHHPEHGHSGCLEGNELVVLSHAAHCHHRGQQGRKRQGHRQDGAAAPEEEFSHYAEAESLADQFVDVDPEELHHQDENDHQEDHEEWSYESGQYESVDFLHQRDA